MRFDVHQIGPGRRTQLLHRERLMVRLGENVFLTRRLEPGAIRRSLQAFAAFRRTATDLRVGKIVAFATSALREAEDGGEFLKAVRATSGIELRVISGQEEAQLIALGVLAHKRSLRGAFALVDIGGGSTEISVCRDRRILHTESFPLGTARLQQVFLKRPAGAIARGEPADLEPLRRHVKSVLLPRMLAEAWPQTERILGSSGTIKALARVARKMTGSNSIEREWLRKMVKAMSRMSHAELLEIPGMDPKRTEMILAGALLLEECMEALGASTVDFTAYCLRDGILRREVRAMQRQPAPSRDSDPQPSLAPLYARAVGLGRNRKNLRRLVASAETLFNRLRHLHKLDPHWCQYLKMAVILRNVGKAISPIRYAQHSYYIVKNLDLPVTSKWEKEFVAQLCLHHKQGKLSPEDLPFKGKKMQAQQKAFQKLLALLRIIDALDATENGTLRPRQIRIQPKRVKLTLAGGHWVELAKLRIQSQKALFEKVFSRLLRAES